MTSKLLANLPIENASDMITDPSTPDITGRVLEFFGTYTQNELPEKQKQSAINWLMNEQEENGSWYGKWGICYIYGTWAVMTGLRALGITSAHPSLKRATLWLEHIQHEDGGWGESCQSSVEKDLLLYHLVHHRKQHGL